MNALLSFLDLWRQTNASAPKMTLYNRKVKDRFWTYPTKIKSPHRTKDNWWELVFSFYHVGSKDWTWIIRLGSKCLYPLSSLAGHYSNPLSLQWLTSSLYNSSLNCVITVNVLYVSYSVKTSVNIYLHTEKWC